MAAAANVSGPAQWSVDMVRRANTSIQAINVDLADAGDKINQIIAGYASSYVLDKSVPVGRWAV